MKKEKKNKVKDTEVVANTENNSSVQNEDKVHIERYKSSSKTKIKKLSKQKVGNQIINLEDLNKLSVEEQQKFFEDTFDKIYSGEEIESLRKYSLRCIKLTCDPKDNKVHLPYGVVVEKKGGKLHVKVSKTKSIILIISLLTVLLLAILASSYSAVNYSLIKNLNKDIDGDGIPDLNLDLNDDKLAEVNIDSNNDNIPEINIDYKANMKPVFNIDTTGNGDPDYNLINRDNNGDGICDINCDTNGDGWPDLNMDVDGDGIADLEIDTDSDGKPDLNFDMNTDMVCDLHCDTDNDLICNEYCLTSEDLENVIPINNGTSMTVGNSKRQIQAGELVLEYEDDNNVYVTDIYPDDQPYFVQEIPPKIFRVYNRSSLYVSYNLKWIVTLNDYESENFKYKVTSTLNGANLDWTTAPKETSPLATEIIIAPFTTQEYQVDFKLQGVGGNQDYDQGKIFAGHIEIYLDNEA